MKISKEVADKVGLRQTKNGIVGDLYQIKQAIELQRRVDQQIENEVEQLQLENNN